jgi:hypothetical protein
MNLFFCLLQRPHRKHEGKGTILFNNAILNIYQINPNPKTYKGSFQGQIIWTYMHNRWVTLKEICMLIDNWMYYSDKEIDNK